MFDKLIKPVSDIVGKFVKDKDLHADSAHEKAMKLQKILEGKDGD